MATKVYTKGFQLPLMRPMPLLIPEPVKWWNIWGGFKNMQVRAQPRSWKIEEDYILDLPWIEGIICIPKGFIFDGASVPRVLWPFMAPTGIMFIAGLYHDVGYRYNHWFDENYNPVYVDAGRRFFDSEFEKIGSYVNDATFTPNVAWGGLWAFGFFAWNTRQKEGHDASVDFPPKVDKE